jgi:hypothetical protein
MTERYIFDDKLTDAMKSLQESFAVSSNAEVIARALALAQVVSEQADEKHTVVVVGKGTPVKVDLTQ